MAMHNSCEDNTSAQKREDWGTPQFVLLRSPRFSHHSMNYRRDRKTQGINDNPIAPSQAVNKGYIIVEHPYKQLKDLYTIWFL